MPDDGIPFDAIRERAHEIWERNHRPEGMEVEFWLVAERELKAERDSKDRRARRETSADPTSTHDGSRQAEM